MNKIANHCSVQRQRLHFALASRHEQLEDLSLKVHCLWFALGGVYALKCNQFTTLLRNTESTMASAWGRRYLNQEKAYATL